MTGTLNEVLDEVARRGSWMGGGSVAALSVALSAALLEKLTSELKQRQRVRRIRQTCAVLVTKDAEAFAHVIRALRGGTSQAFKRSLKAATEIQQEVFSHAGTIVGICRTTRRAVKPRFQSDLQCAEALAEAARRSSKTLIDANLIWLDETKHPTKASTRSNNITCTC